MKKPILTALLIILALIILAGGIYAAVRLCGPEAKEPLTPGELRVHSGSWDYVSYTLSQEDTDAVYDLLTDATWEEQYYAEYVPTHTLVIGDVKYLFNFGEYFYKGFNIIYEGPDGTVQTGRTQKDETLIRKIEAIFAKYE